MNALLLCAYFAVMNALRGQFGNRVLVSACMAVALGKPWLAPLIWLGLVFAWGEYFFRPRLMALRWLCFAPAVVVAHWGEPFGAQLSASLLLAAFAGGAYGVAANWKESRWFIRSAEALTGALLALALSPISPHP